MKEFISPDGISPIELAKRLMHFKGMTGSKVDFETIKKQLVPSESLERVNQIVRGLEQEDEFAVLCRLMETCTSYVKLDQNPIVHSDEQAPDVLATFEPGCSVTGKTSKQIGVKFNCFVEVKSCRKDQFKISEKDLKRRKSFADRYKVPLVFAIRFTVFEEHSFWVLIESSRLQKMGRKIKAESLIDSLGPTIFDDYGVYTHPHLTLVHYYDSELDDDGIKHKKYGVLFRTFVATPGDEPLEIDDKDSALVNFIVESFGFEELQVLEHGTVTGVVSKIGAQMRFLSDLIYRVNNLAREDNGEKVYDATRVVSSIDSDKPKPTLLTRSVIEYGIRLLNQRKPMLFKMGIGEPEQQEKILRSVAKK